MKRRATASSAASCVALILSPNMVSPFASPNSVPPLRVSRRSLKRSCFWIIALLALAVVRPVVAESNRRTTDWRADLINELIERRMSDTAAAICRRHVEQAEPLSDTAARWAIRWSSVRTAQIVASDDVGASQIEAAKQPVANLLQSYPDHERRWWLRAQLAMVDFAAAQHAVTAHGVAGDREELQTRALDRLAVALRQFDELQESLQSELARIASATQASRVTSADLITLQQNLGSQRVKALLLRSKLFPLGSEDAIASATQAATAADEVLSRMQPTASLHPEVQLLKAEAVYRSGDAAQADRLLEKLQESLDGRLPPEALALQVRIAIAEDSDEAAEILRNYYGDDPAAAAVSVEMDLARLRWLLEQRSSASAEASSPTSQIADWLDAIERRSGVYARRRGEAETLEQMRVAPGSSDVRLLAAEAAKQLREGHSKAAAELLTQAARSATEGEQAVAYAQQAAAVFLSIEQPRHAREILAQTSRRHQSAPAAAQAHLQAAVVASRALQETEASDVEPLITILKQHAALWPQDATTKKAVPWLLQILQAADRDAEAARFLMNQPVLTQEAVRRAGTFWRQALRELDDVALQASLAQEAIDLLALNSEHPPQVRGEAAWQAASIATLFGSRAQLQTVRSRETEPIDDVASERASHAFIQSLLRFRLEGRPASTLELTEASLDRSTLADAARRLAHDAATHGRDRRRLGMAILRLLEAYERSNETSEAGPTGDDAVSLDPFLQPYAQVWAGEWQAAIERLDELVSQAPEASQAEALQRAATILADSDAREAQREAIRYWNTLAQGLPQGSPSWHRAKLAVARLLLELGETKQAKQISQFVLITRPPDDPELRAEYEAIQQQ